MVLFSEAIGGAVAVTLALVRGEPFPQGDDVIWAILAGLAGPTGLVFFYRGLASGRMGVVAPIAGVLGAALPILIGTILEGSPAPAQVIGIILAVTSVVLVTRSAEPGSSGSTGAGLGIISGICFGLFFVFLGQVDAAAVFGPLVLVRITSAILIVGVVLVARAPWRLVRSSLVLVVIAGVLDMGGNLWYLLAAQNGRLDVAAVLASLYPVVTILLAAGVLRERIGPIQAVGILAAVGAIVLIAS